MRKSGEGGRVGVNVAGARAGNVEGLGGANVDGHVTAKRMSVCVSVWRVRVCVVCVCVVCVCVCIFVVNVPFFFCGVCAYVCDV